MLKLIRFILGYMMFDVTGSFPERFINLAAGRGVCLFNVKKNKDSLLCASIASEYNALLQIAKRSGMKIAVTKKAGLPFIIKKYKNRYGMLAGVLLFFLIQFLLSLYIWDVSVYGNNKIEEQEILSLVGNLGLRKGVLKSCINPSLAENYLLNELSDVSWASVNLLGSRVNIEIKEKVTVPDILPKDSPCNIKASNDAQIVRLEVYKGIPEVKVGDAVTKGQMLVSGVVEDSFGQSRILHSEAKIFAKTKKMLEEEVDLRHKEEIKLKKNIKRKLLTIFNANIPLTFVPIPKGNFKRETKIKNLKLFGARLPVSLYEEDWNKYETKEVYLTKEQAKEIAFKNIKRRESLEFKDIKILGYVDDFKLSGRKLLFTRKYDCIEDIAEKEPIILR